MLKRVFNIPFKALQVQKLAMPSQSFALFPALYTQQKRFYHPEGIQLRNDKNGYFLDPEDVSRRFTKLIAMHDKCKDPSKITLGSTFFDLGLDDLAVVELMVEAEQEFYMEFPEDDLEKLRTVEDVVEYVSRSFFAQ